MIGVCRSSKSGAFRLRAAAVVEASLHLALPVNAVERFPHMARNFYFGKTADVVDGSANFASVIAADFASLGLTSAQSTAFGTLNAALQTAWSVSVEPSTRTRVTIAAKNLALRNMRSSAILL